MTELSLCMIVKNEEERLARCLSSVQGAVDEIIILDTGSTDGTKDVASRFTQRVYDYAWDLALIHIGRCRRLLGCRSRGAPSP